MKRAIVKVYPIAMVEIHMLDGNRRGRFKLAIDLKDWLVEKMLTGVNGTDVQEFLNSVNVSGPEMQRLKKRVSSTT